MTIKNSSQRGYRSIILALAMIMFMLLSISFSSALLPTKEYNEVTKTVTIYDWLGLDKVAEVQLNTPQIMNVVPGHDRLVAEFTVNLDNNEYKDFINSMELINNHNGKRFERGLSYKYKTIHYIDVDDYEQICQDDNVYGKIMKLCSPKKTGTTHKEERATWTSIEKLDLQKGIVTIGIFTDVEAGDNVEWIPTMFGVQVEEWAIWQSSYNAGLVSYWKLDQNTTGTGGILDSVAGINNGTITGAIPRVTGKIANATNFTIGGTTNKITLGTSTTLFPANNNMTITAWVYPGANGNYPTIMARTDQTNHNYLYALIGTTGKPGIFTQGGAAWHSATTALTLNAWNFVSVSISNGAATFYLNGGANGTSTESWTTSAATAYIGFYGANAEFPGTIDEVGFWNRSLSATEISDMYNLGTGMTYTNVFGGAMTMSLNSPANGFNSSSSTVTFNCTANSTLGVLNTTLIIDGADNYTVTNATAFQNVSLQISRIMNDSNHTWTCRGSDGSGLGADPITASAIKLTVDTIPPGIVINYPTNTSYTTNVTEMNYTYSDLHPGTCKYSFNGGTTNFTLPSCAMNLTGNTSIEGSNTWELYANDTHGNFNKTSVTFFKDTILPAVSWNALNPADGYFSKTGTFILYADASDTNLVNVTLNLYNSTRDLKSQNLGTLGGGSYIHLYVGEPDGLYWYNATAADILNNRNTTVTRNITIDTVYPSIYITSPVGDLYMPPENISINFSAKDTNRDTCWLSRGSGANITLPGCLNASFPITMLGNNNWTVYVNDSAGNVNLNSTAFYAYSTLGFCSGETAMLTMNFTFKDESTDAVMNATLDASTWTYYTGSDTARTRTLLFNNGSHNYEYDFCIYPNWTSITSSINFQYAHSLDVVYPQRQWQESAFSLTNTTTLKTLYLLPSTAGQYVTFQIINPALQPLSATTVNAYRTIGGTNTLIETKVTDSSGSAMMWLNPLYLHTITAEKTGYLTSSSSITPSQTSYTITLSQLGTTNITDTVTGVVYSIEPSESYLNPLQTYNFNFTIASPSLTLSRYWFNITDDNGNYVASAMSTTPGTISTSLNVWNNDSMIMLVYYNVSGQVVSTSKYWLITNLSGSDWSIKNFFTDLDTYTDSGIFGLDSFGITVIIFIIIMLTTGIMAYNFGLYSPASIAGIMTLLVGFFDAGLGMIQYPFGVTLPFATIAFGIIFIALLFKEATSY